MTTNMSKIHIFITETVGKKEHCDFVFCDTKEEAEKKIQSGVKIKQYDGSVSLALFVDRIKEAQKISAINNSGVVISTKEMNINLKEMKEIKTPDQQMFEFAMLLSDNQKLNEEEQKFLKQIANKFNS
jgi:hypothetical protein